MILSLSRRIATAAAVVLKIRCVTTAEAVQFQKQTSLKYQSWSECSILKKTWHSLQDIPQNRFSKGKDVYWNDELSDNLRDNLRTLENSLKPSTEGQNISSADIERIISNRYFKDQFQNIICDLPRNKEIERLNDLRQKILALFRSRDLSILSIVRLYEQTLQLEEVQRSFIANVVKTSFSIEEKVLHKYAEFICRHYEKIRVKNLNDLSVDSISNYINQLNLDELSLWDISLLLEIDNTVFNKYRQVELVNSALKRILSTKKFQSQQELNAVLEILVFARRRRVRLGSDAKLIMHLAEVLPIESLSKAMLYIKLSNYEYEDIIALYGFLAKKYFATYKIDNINLLNAMNVFMPAQSAANFYIADLHAKFEEGDYNYLIERLPSYVNLFHPNQNAIAYLCDRVSLKLASSLYSEVEKKPIGRRSREAFVSKLSQFLTALLHGDLLKNDFFVAKTLQFIWKMVQNGNIQERDTLYSLSYFVNQVDVSSKPHLSEIVDKINVLQPPRESKQSQSNTQTKIFKFLLQTNFYALQNVKIGQFTADILVHPNLIIEYNGYHHYKFDLKQKGYKFDQFTLQHMFREKQIRKHHPQYKIANINFRQWHALQDLEKQYKFLQELVQKHE